MGEGSWKWSEGVVNGKGVGNEVKALGNEMKAVGNGVKEVGNGVRDIKKGGSIHLNG